ncbi:Hsp20/alpha crystallin family protein [Paludibacterium paludis]|uniref:Hsp20/alpha crystallin family protein n=1 Tax=Paludibacterium paludis TaxID=1225769 RepID=UPI001C0540E0|nr:Hsp20/alpha crystallin family protein [Paludibacterium paludis]
MSDTPVTKENTPSRGDAAMVPPVDVIEDASGITLYADLPGVPKDRLHLSVDSGSLTIAGDVVLPLAEGLESTRAEIDQPRYWRTFSLSRELDIDKVTAEFSDGVLTLRIPKTEQALPRKIEIKVA